MVYGVAQAEGKPLGQGLCYNVGVEVDFGKIGQALDDLGQVTRNLAQSPMATNASRMVCPVGLYACAAHKPRVNATNRRLLRFLKIE